MWVGLESLESVPDESGAGVGDPRTALRHAVSTGSIAKIPPTHKHRHAN